MPYNRPYQRGDGYDVSTPPLQYKQYGVKAIQAELFRLGVLTRADKVNGYFGWYTKWAVKKFQRVKGLGDDGVAGPATLDVLFRPLVEHKGAPFSVPTRLLTAVIQHESQFDPGAYYFNEASTDRGLCMLNSSAYPNLSDPEAFDPEQAIPEAASRLTLAYEKFRFKGQTLRRECTIASYNSPAGARDHFEGKPISEKLRGYIDSVLEILAANK